MVIRGQTALPNGIGNVHKNHKKDSKGTKTVMIPLYLVLFVVVFVPFVYVPDPVGQSSLTPNYFFSSIRSASRASLKFGLYRNAVSIWRFASSMRFIFARATP